jgi:hypothetical protein
MRMLAKVVALVCAFSACDWGLGDEPAPVGSCAPAFPQGAVRVSTVETPADTLGEDGLLERVLFIARQEQRVEGGQITAVLSYQSAWVLGRMSLETASPWEARDSTGARLRWSRFRAAARCGDGTAALLAEDVLRDAEGRLLLLTASVPLADHGKVPVIASLAPEIELEWQDIGCEERTDSEGYPAVTVGLLGKVEGQRWAAGLGAWTRFSLAGRDYLATASLAERRTGRDCGAARLVLFEDGFFARGHDAVPPQ